MCCNEARTQSYIVNFICENFIKAKYISLDEIHFLIFNINNAIEYLKHNNMLVNEYYMQGEFYMKANDDFTKVLHYDSEVKAC